MLGVMALLIFRSASATHLRAGNITVTRTACNTNQVVVNLHVFTKWATQVKFGGGTLNFGDGTTMILDPRPNPPVIALNDNGNIGDVEVSVPHTYASPGTYTISYTEQNRDQGILNMDNSVNIPFFLQTQIAVDPLIGCNNSPVLQVPPVDQGCTGVSWSYNTAAYDADGDSLSYSLSVPGKGASYDASGNFLSAIPVDGYRLPNEIGFYNSIGISYPQANEGGNGPPVFYINPTTGTIVWDAPGAAGEYVISILVKEWRKKSGQWVMLGFVESDLQILIEDCKNKRPHLLALASECVEAGALVKTVINATDPDGNAGDSLAIQLYSPALALGASYSPPTTSLLTPAWQPALTPTQQAQVQFTWQTDCSDVAPQPYPIVTKAFDNGAVRLATFAITSLHVVAPSPQWVGVSVAPDQRSAQLTWQSYTSAHVGVSNSSVIQIWRKVGSNPFVPGTCTTGMPDSAGYELQAQVPITATTYTDTHLAAGAKYCYRLVAVLKSSTGLPAPGIASQETCLPTLLVKAPVMTAVTIDVTDSEAGQITVRWRSPVQADKIQFPPPYSFQVLRAVNSTATGDLKAAHTGKLADSVFVDTKMNTLSPNIFYYRVVAYSSNGNVIDSAAVASSVLLTATASNKKIELRWKGTLPWSNNTKEYPMHLIYRGQGNVKTVSDLSLIDSVDVGRNGMVYLDSGQYHATPLVENQSYRYVVMTRGSYASGLLKSPLINFSEISSSVFAITETTSVPSDVTLYPNPIENSMKIKGMAGEVIWVQGFDATGKIFDILLTTNESGYEADVTHLPTGLCLVRVQTTLKTYQFKFLKK